MTVLVTGAAGFVGNNLVRRLVEQGKPVRAMARHLEKANQRLADIKGKVEIIQGDVTDPDSLERAVSGVTAVVHLVALAIEKGGRTYDGINHQGTVNVVDAAKAAGVNRFVYMSQNNAAPEHESAFLRSKGRAQQYVTESGLQWTALRPSVIFGQQDEFVNSIARLVRLTPVIFPNIGGGKALFQPISVHDVVEAAVRSLDDEGTIGKALALGGPEILTLETMEKRIFRAMGTKRWLFPAPAGLLKPIVFLMEKTLPGAPVNLSLLELLKVPNVVDDNALMTYFNLDPRPFIGEHIAYLKDITAGEALRKIFTGATVN